MIKVISKKTFFFFEKYSAIICLGFFFLGIGLTAWTPSFGQLVSGGVNKMIEYYSYFVPFLLYLLFTPAIIRTIEISRKYNSGVVFSIMKRFTLTRLAALFFICTMLFIFLGLPIHSNDGMTFVSALKQTAVQLGKALFGSTYLYGIYAAIATFFIAQRSTKIEHFFHNIGSVIESAGEYLMLLSPLFMFAIGSFLYDLPTYLQTSLGQNEQGLMHILNLNFFGLNMVPQKFVFIWLYFVISLVTGALCIAWHFLHLAKVKMDEPKFSLKYYFKNYWLKVYPLLWASCSETLGVPISLNLIRKNFPEVPAGIRQFVISGGSYLGINGTLICVYVMGVFIATVLGVQISYLQLLSTIPVIFILGYAVPGIPGELIIFAGTMNMLLGIPAAISPLFVALYATLQIGLPDSFRTGCNSTDSALISMDVTYSLNLKEETEHEKKSVSQQAGVLLENAKVEIIS